LISNRYYNNYRVQIYINSETSKEFVVILVFHEIIIVVIITIIGKEVGLNDDTSNSQDEVSTDVSHSEGVLGGFSGDFYSVGRWEARGILTNSPNDKVGTDNGSANILNLLVVL